MTLASCEPLEVTALDDSSRAEWNRYVDGAAAASLYHRYEWRDIVKRAFGKDSVYLAARSAGGAWAGVLPLVHMKSPLFGNFMVSMPYVNYGGVLADSAVARNQLLQQAQAVAGSLGCEHIEYRHWHADAADLPARCNKVTMVLALPESSEALWEGFKPKLRAQIRRPMKAGAVFEIGGEDLLDDFYGVFAENMRDLGTPVYSCRFFREVLRSVEAARVGLVRLNGQPVAAGIVLGYRGRLEIPWASARRKYNPLSPNMLLYSGLLEWAVQQGYREFDFGRCTRDSGTYRFKRQWGAEELPLVWHYWQRTATALPELNPDNPKYALMVRAWQHLPVSVTRLVGPAIVKHLP